MLSILTPGDNVIVPNPAYPIHIYSVIISRGDVQSIPLYDEDQLLDSIQKVLNEVWPRPKVLILSFPNNPTTMTASTEFFEKNSNSILATTLFRCSEIIFVPEVYVFDG